MQDRVPRKTDSRGREARIRNHVLHTALAEKELTARGFAWYAETTICLTTPTTKVCSGSWSQSVDNRLRYADLP